MRLRILPLKRLLHIRALAKILVAFFLMVHPGVISGQTQQVSIALSRAEARSEIQDLQSELLKFKTSAALESVKATTNSLLSLVQSVSNEDQLKAIEKYFAIAEHSLANSTADSQKMTVIQFINNDLALKGAKGIDSASRISEVINSFKVMPFTVEALISGTPVAPNKYRLYWAPFFGGPLDSITNNTISEGHSPTLANPYQINLMLPGYKTFWLKEVATDKFYKPDIVYSELKLVDTRMQISFKPL